MNKLTLLSLLFTATIIMSCSDDDTNVNALNCPDSEIVGIQFQTASTTTRFGVADFVTTTPGILVSQIGPTQNFTTNTFQTQLNMHDGAYNTIDGSYVNVDNGNNTLYKLTSAGVLTTPALPANVGTINAPEFINGNLYFGNVEYFNNYLEFRVLDSNYATLQTVTINNPSTSVNYYSSFTSTTNGVDKLYYVIGTNLITYDINTTTTTTTVIGSLNYSGNLLGIEYVDATHLLVLRHDFNGADTELVQLDISNPTAVIETNVVNLSYKANEENFSTTYDKCNKRYFIVTKSQDFSTTHYTRVDLSASIPVVSTNSNNSIYVAGIKSRN
ncbi:hypothetical protein ACFSX9_05345 [Flavobacterium ardleyense]|uniref:Lipoprotein n=1 Tax=Flavobacterium ardleyense TaxID=2038737 RepID=A0ABW5Z6R8_9FLAO